MSRLRIIVAGMAAQYPIGGVAWDYPAISDRLCPAGPTTSSTTSTWCWPYCPPQRTMTDDPAYSAGYLRDFFARYAPELSERWHYLHLHETSCGMTRAAFDEFARSADLFLNVSGGSFFQDTLSPNCLKVFLDSDPGYNQYPQRAPVLVGECRALVCRVHAHDRHFTYAGIPGTRIARCRRPALPGARRGCRWCQSCGRRGRKRSARHRRGAR